MLTEMDKRLIAKEEKRFPNIEKLISLLDSSNPIKSIEELFENYNVQETTQHWYDGSPRFNDGTIKCDLCEDKKCNNCEVWEKWNKSEKQLSFNNWIDVYGPDIWGMSQEECDEQAKEILTKALSKKENLDRLFFVNNTIDTIEYYSIFYYNRDREYFDWWFVFKRKEK